MNKATEIYSIYGQIEAAAAETMIDRGLATKIEKWDVPATQQFNEQNQPVKFAIVIAGINVPAFNKLIRSLRS